MVLGGGVTGAQQVCDLALNQHVRRNYGMLEADKLIHQMRCGVNLPTSTEEDSLAILNQIWNASDKLHMQAAEGFKQAGLSVDLYGSEDSEIAKEACDAWWAPVPPQYGNFNNMRDKINDELQNIRKPVSYTHLRAHETLR